MTVRGRTAQALATLALLAPRPISHAKELLPSPQVPAATAAAAVAATDAAKAPELGKDAPGPRMVIEQDVFDAGQVVRGAQASATFVVKNEGTEPLKILSAKPG